MNCQERQDNIWHEKYNSLTRPLKHWTIFPENTVEIVPDPEAWQEVKTVPVQQKEKYYTGETVFFDFSEHAVGYISLRLNIHGDYDSPLFLRILAAETPYELTYVAKNYRGCLSKAWIQEEFIKLDILPDSFVLPRRYACRFLAVEIVASPAPVSFKKVSFMAESSACSQLPAPPDFLDMMRKDIYTVGLRTLRNCMQNIFEDGPKRDRRLWLGDLRLQAMANSVSFKNYELVERSLYLLAAGTDESGIFPSCAYEKPVGKRGCNVLEYPLLLAVVLLEHLQWYGRRKIAEELYPLAELQFSRLDSCFDNENLFHVPENEWLFVDHCPGLEKETAFQSIYIWGLRALLKLAKLLGNNDIWKLEIRIRVLTDALLKHRFDEKTGLFFSGKKHQFSSASQIWAVLAGLGTPNDGKELLKRLSSFPGAMAPVSPYLQHYLLEAYWHCGDIESGLDLLDNYWGNMISTGTSTFFEVFKPDDPFFSSYKDAMVNSACHAWSCTPVWFLQQTASSRQCPPVKRFASVHNL